VASTVTEIKRKAGRPSRANAEALTNRLLDDALKMFCEVGFGDASIERLASNANSAKHTIYRRFPSKEDLLRAVVEREIVRLNEMRREVYKQHRDTPLAAIRKIMKQKFDTLLRPEVIAFRRVLVAEAMRVADLFDTYENHLSRDGILPQLITTAIRGGELTRRPVPEVIEILDALILANVTIQSLVSPTRSSNVKHHTAYFSKRWKLFLSVASPG
jgi:AcrR family transcriptional regulator